MKVRVHNPAPPPKTCNCGREANPCTTCGFGVPANPPGFATGRERVAWGMQQVGRPIANPAALRAAPTPPKQPPPMCGPFQKAVQIDQGIWRCVPWYSGLCPPRYMYNDHYLGEPVCIPPPPGTERMKRPGIFSRIRRFVLKNPIAQLAMGQPITAKVSGPPQSVSQRRLPPRGAPSQPRSFCQECIELGGVCTLDLEGKPHCSFPGWTVGPEKIKASEPFEPAGRRGLGPIPSSLTNPPVVFATGPISAMPGVMRPRSGCDRPFVECRHKVHCPKGQICNADCKCVDKPTGVTAPTRGNPGKHGTACRPFAGSPTVGRWECEFIGGHHEVAGSCECKGPYITPHLPWRPSAAFLPGMLAAPPPRPDPGIPRPGRIRFGPWRRP